MTSSVVMRRALAAAIVSFAVPLGAFAQSAPNWSYGYVPSTGEQRNAFAKKQDLLPFAPLNPAGGTMTGPLGIAPSTAGRAGMSILPGATPSAPSNGNVWLTGTGLYVQYGGTTHQLLDSALAFSSPAFTGTPTAPTPAAGSSSSQIANTAWVANALSSYLPLSQAASTYAPLVSPTFTGLPAAPALQLGGQLGTEPTVSGFGYQSFAQRRMTGAAGSGVNGSLELVLSDDVDAGGGFNIVRTIQSNNFGGPNAKGGRKGFQVSVAQGSPTSPANTNRNYEAIAGYMTVGPGDGGDSLTFGSETSPHGAKGGYFGMTCALFGGNAQYTLHQSCYYADYFNAPGGSAKFVNALFLGGQRAWRGNDVDAQIMSSGGDTASLVNVTWRHLYATSDATSGSPVDFSTTLYGTAWLPWPVAAITKATGAVITLPADITTPRIGFASAHVGDQLTVAGVTGETGFNGVYTVAAVSSATRTYTTSRDTSALTGTPNFSNATVTITRARIAHGIDLRGYLADGYAFASPNFGVDGVGNLTAPTATLSGALSAASATVTNALTAGQVNLASSTIKDTGTALQISQNTGGTVLQIKGVAASGSMYSLEARTGSNNAPIWYSSGDFTIRTTGGGTLDMNFPTQTTSPSAGTAGALPSAPKGYVKMYNSGSGNPMLIPYY